MTIELKVALPRELREAGFRAGDRTNARQAKNADGGELMVRGWRDQYDCWCTVMPENYIKVSKS